MRAVALDHVVLEVADVDRSLEFYVNVLGLAPERVAEFQAGAAGFPSVRAGSVLIDLFPRERPAPGPNHLCVEVDVAADAMTAELDQHEVPHGAAQRRWGARGEGWSVYVHDPDGHQVEVRTYRERG